MTTGSSPWKAGAGASNKRADHREAVAASVEHAIREHSETIHATAVALVNQIPDAFKAVGVETSSPVMRVLTIVMMLSMQETTDAVSMAAAHNKELDEALADVREHADHMLHLLRETADDKMVPELRDTVRKVRQQMAEKKEQHG